jgi:hypothetical protein
MAKQKASRERCPLCGEEFATRAEHEEHKEIVHSTLNRKTNLEIVRDSDDIEPADGTPTTELPLGAEALVKQSSTRTAAPRDLGSRNSGSRNSGGRAKSKRAGK